MQIVQAIPSVLALAILTTTAVGQGATADPPSGGLGTVVTLTGTGFGTGKPEVTAVLGQDAWPLKVKQFSDTQVTAIVDADDDGALSIEITPKGATSPVASADFELLAPQPTQIVPDTAAPGEEVTVNGTGFGSGKAPLVTIEGVVDFSRKAKVKSLTDTAITIVVPKSVPNGPFNVKIVNKLVSAGIGGLTVSGSSAKIGKPFISVNVDGEQFLFKGSKLKGTWTTPLTYAYFPKLNVDGVTEQFLIGFWHQPGDPLPTTYEGDPPPAPRFLGGPLGWNEVVAGDVTTWVSIGNDVWHITVVHAGGNQIDGFFSGTLEHFPLPDKVVEGEFRLSVPKGP